MPVAWPSAEHSPIACHYRPPLSVGVPTAIPGFDEALYRDADERRRRQLQREEEALTLAQQQSKPRLSRASRVLCQGRLERELRTAFVQCGAPPSDSPGEAKNLPRERISCVLECLGLLCGHSEEEETFCAKLCLLLDKEDKGVVSFERLLGFLSHALDREEQSHGWKTRPEEGGAPPTVSLEEECFRHLEQQLLRASSLLVSNRLSRPRGEAPARSASPAPRTMLGMASPASTARCAATPRPLAERGGVTRQRPASASRVAAPSEDTQISRCHLLYQQAVFASRESALLEEEIKVLRRREEMRECTFRPRLMPFRRGSPPAQQPRNFETTVARMRAANRRRLEQREEKEHVPCGENYERLRKLGVQPFSCAFKDTGVTRPPPLMYVDVNVGHGRTGRIGVHEGDDLRVVSRNFAKTFQLDADAALKLETILQQAYNEQRRCCASSAVLASTGAVAATEAFSETHGRNVMEEEAMQDILVRVDGST